VKHCEGNSLRTIAKGVALTTLLCLTSSALAEEADAVEYRKHVMKTLGEQLAAIDMIVAKKAPPDAFAVHVKTIAITTTQAKKAFELKVAGGASKPEVWSNWADFSKRLDAMVAAADGLAKEATTGNAASVGPKIKTALDCEGCHKIYMVPGKG
jgi:cytochrome c556